MKRTRCLWMAIASLCALSHVACGSQAKQAKAREILGKHSSDLDALEERARSLDDFIQRLERVVAELDRSDPEDHWSAMMAVTVPHEYLGEYEGKYEAFLRKIDAEVTEAGLSRVELRDALLVHWSERGVAGDPGDLRTQLDVCAQQVSVTSGQLETAVCRGLYRWMEPNWPQELPRDLPNEVEMHPRTIDRALGGIRFRLAAPTEFSMRYDDGYVVPITSSFDIVVEQELVFEGQPLGSGSRLRRVHDGKWNLVAGE